jgi:hypothetical protein
MDIWCLVAIQSGSSTLSATCEDHYKQANLRLFPSLTDTFNVLIRIIITAVQQRNEINKQNIIFLLIFVAKTFG